MKLKITWLSDEEASIVITRFCRERYRLALYDLGQDQAELRVDWLYGLTEVTTSQELKNSNVISRVTKALNMVRKALIHLNYSSVLLVTERNSNLQKILYSTGVVRLAFREYMLKKNLLVYKATDKGNVENNHLRLLLESEDTGFECRGYLEEESQSGVPVFFCRLNSYLDGWYLHGVEVKEQFRGKGIGTAAMNQLLVLLSHNNDFSHGNSFPLYLQVGSYNEAALHLYQKLQFTVATELCYYQLI